MADQPPPLPASAPPGAQNGEQVDGQDAEQAALMSLEELGRFLELGWFGRKILRIRKAAYSEQEWKAYLIEQLDKKAARAAGPYPRQQQS